MGKDEIIAYLKTLTTDNVIAVGIMTQSNALRNLVIEELMSSRKYTAYSAAKALALTESVVRNVDYRYRKRMEKAHARAQRD